MFESNVFSRTAATGAEISAARYNLIIGATLLVGFGINYAMLQAIPAASIAALNPWVFFIGFFACALAGCFLFNASDTPAVSFVGYLLVVAPFGLVINVAVSHYDPAVVFEAVQATGLVTLVMMLLGSMYPGFFFGIARGLSVALLATIVVELVLVLVFHRTSSIVDWIVVLVFSGYIGVDWARANRIPRTVDNAIDSAAALYMDIVNLFLRLLRIFARR